MFWTGFWCGVLAILVLIAVVSTAMMIIAYKGAPMAEDDE